MKYILYQWKTHTPTHTHTHARAHFSHTWHTHSHTHTHLEHTSHATQGLNPGLGLFLAGEHSFPNLLDGFEGAVNLRFQGPRQIQIANHFRRSSVPRELHIGGDGGGGGSGGGHGSTLFALLRLFNHNKCSSSLAEYSVYLNLARCEVSMYFNFFVWFVCSCVCSPSASNY